MTEADLKAVLRRYLQTSREALLWKLEGLSERELRLPRTPTGTSLLGLVKHMANVEIGYFGDTFGRAWPTPEERVFADELLEAAPLDAPGQVPWWPADRADVTLGQVLVHVLTDLARHAGHADILREQVDGAVGLRDGNGNIPDIDWSSYVAKLAEIADRT